MRETREGCPSLFKSIVFEALEELQKLRLRVEKPFRHAKISLGAAKGDFFAIYYFFRFSTALRRAVIFSSLVAQLEAKRMAEWSASTRSQYS